MKAVFALYHDYNFEARAPELISVLGNLGITEICMVTYEKANNLPSVKQIISKKGSLKYFHFVYKSLKTIRSEKPDIILLHDNACAPILAHLVHRGYKGIIIYDSSELYIDRIKPKSIKLLIANIRPICEKKYLKRSDIVIAANEERATIMKEYFTLPELPLVLNNIHRIEDEIDIEVCKRKFETYTQQKKFLVVYGGGVYKERRTVELAETIVQLGNDYLLLIAGSGDDGEVDVLDKLIKSNRNGNVFYLGKLARSEWKYLTTVAQCSVSLFPQDTPNNIYCASGKFYESVLEGTPVIASENPPFLNACKEYGFGVSSNNIKQAIIEMKTNYTYYKDNALHFSNTYDYKDRIRLLSEQINERLSRGK